MDGVGLCQIRWKILKSSGQAAGGQAYLLHNDNLISNNFQRQALRLAIPRVIIPAEVLATVPNLSSPGRRQDNEVVGQKYYNQHSPETCVSTCSRQDTGCGCGEGVRGGKNVNLVSVSDMYVQDVGRVECRPQVLVGCEGQSQRARFGLYPISIKKPRGWPRRC